MCILWHNNQVVISENMIYFLTCFVRILGLGTGQFFRYDIRIDTN